MSDRQITWRRAIAAAVSFAMMCVIVMHSEDRTTIAMGGYLAGWFSCLFLYGLVARSTYKRLGVRRTWRRHHSKKT